MSKTIGILSTARKISQQELSPAIQWLEKHRYRFVLGETIGASADQFAGDDTLRAKDLQEMINAPDIDIIWCARGGYGTARILDRVDFSSLLKRNKIIVGYSDVTALHAHLNTLNIPSIHATMPINVADNSTAALESLQQLWEGKTNHYTWEDTVCTHQLQTIEGEIVGGNLSVLYSILGSASNLQTDNKILFIEDLDEYLYHIDRMILNLKRNGYFSHLKALVIGAMTQMHDNAVPFGKTTQEIILSHTESLGFPVIFGFPAGHIPDNRAILLGEKAVFHLNGKEIHFHQ